MYTIPELTHQLADSGARTVIVLENFAHTVAAALPSTAVKHVIVTRLGDHCSPLKRAIVNFVVKHVKRLVRPWHIAGAVAYRDALARGATLPYAAPRLTGRDLAFLQYTGGTTGRAKGAMLTQRNMIANTLQAAAWARPFFTRRTSVVVTPLPLYHVYSLTANLFCFMELGGHNLLITDPRDMKGFIALLRKTRFGFMTGVNTLFNGLLHTPGFDSIDFSSLRVCMGGGMAVQREVAERWQAVTGVADRARLRPHGSVADRHGQAAASQGVQRLGGRAVSLDGRRDLRRRAARSSASARSARSARAVRKSWPAIGSAPKRLRKCCSATAGCAPATSDGSMRRATCSSRIARRTSSSSRASRSIRTRSRMLRCARPACAKQRRSACRTPNPAKP